MNVYDVWFLGVGFVVLLFLLPLFFLRKAPQSQYTPPLKPELIEEFYRKEKGVVNRYYRVHGMDEWKKEETYLDRVPYARLKYDGISVEKI